MALPIHASLRLRLTSALLGLCTCSTPSVASQADALAKGFAAPPPEARPRTWWHWMNGNITAEGAKRDLEWMKRVGIGGVQIFEGSLGTPRVVPKPLVWMTSEWKAAFRESIKTASDLGLDVQVATSPGWSISGAPFVAPADAMKKLVWARLDVRGGKPVSGLLPKPPSNAGPLQDMPSHEGQAHAFYRDVAVLAFPAAEPSLVPASITGSAGLPVDRNRLADGHFEQVVELPFDPRTGEGSLVFDFGKKAKIASFTLGLHAPTGFGAPPSPGAVVEVSIDGKVFQRVATLEPNSAQARAASFDPREVRYARLILQGVPGVAGTPPVGKGVVPMPSAAPPTGFRISEARFSATPQVDHWVEKAGFSTARDYYAIPTPPSASRAAVKTGAVLDLTKHLRPDGALDWTPPAGSWTILRLGYSLTGKHNGPAPVEATGLEVDKLDADAVARYADQYLSLYEDTVGQELIGRTGITGLLSDSIEAGNQNWTPRMIEAFRERRGYDPIPWLPVLTGVVIGSAEESDRFLWDYRKTISDLLTDAHYAVLSAKARQRGLTYYAEALEDHRPQLGDDLAIRAQADVPMGAIWWAPAGEPPRATLVADILGAASVANIYGKKFVGAESLTAFGHPWAFAPRDLKATADLEFALGVNRVIIHTSTHQPFEGKKPGLNLLPLLGQYFTRNETWAEMASGWTDYLARSSWLLQQGHHAADIAYFIGEEAPVTGLYGDKPFDGLPDGYSFDFLGADGLQNAVKVAPDGAVVSKGGVRYRMIVLGGSSRRMTLATLMRLRDMVAAGATLVGPRPEATPSLADEPAHWTAAVEALWGVGDQQAASRGHVYCSLDEAVTALGLTRDWMVEGEDIGRSLAVLHRTLPQGELWFVSNRLSSPFRGEISFRVSARTPEFWDAVKGDRRPAPYRIVDGRTVIPMDLDASGSGFVLFGEATTQTSLTPPPVQREELAKWDDGWTLALDADAPAMSLDRLHSWTEFDHPEKRYFSGVGTYRRSVDIKPDWLSSGRKVLIDLGAIGDIAEVSVNGRNAGVVWTSPYALDIGRLLRQGANKIEIRVANLWANRLIGDAQPGADQQAETFSPTYNADAELTPSGLLQPVRLISEVGGQ